MVASEWPIHDLAEHYLLSVHMVQHLLISLVAPPMLLLGMPHWLLRKLEPGARVLADRNYIYVKVPDEIVGAKYLLRRAEEHKQGLAPQTVRPATLARPESSALCIGRRLMKAHVLRVWQT